MGGAVGPRKPRGGYVVLSAAEAVSYFLGYFGLAFLEGGGGICEFFSCARVFFLGGDLGGCCVCEFFVFVSGFLLSICLSFLFTSCLSFFSSEAFVS